MKIGLLDHMGYDNLGDAATQEALIANIKTRMPDAIIVGFSLNPHDTRKRHNILSYSITHWHPGLNKSGQTSTDGRNLRSRLKSILKKIPGFSPYGLVRPKSGPGVGASRAVLQSPEIPGQSDHRGRRSVV